MQHLQNPQGAPKYKPPTVEYGSLLPLCGCGRGTGTIKASRLAGKIVRPVHLADFCLALPRRRVFLGTHHELQSTLHAQCSRLKFKLSLSADELLCLGEGSSGNYNL